VLDTLQRLGTRDVQSRIVLGETTLRPADCSSRDEL
jgi:hypothetical protein